MKRFLFRLSPVRAFFLALFGFAVVVPAAWYIVFSRPAERVYALKLSMGREIEPPKRITTFFRNRSAAHGIKFTLVDTDGSEDSLARIDRGELDLAVVKGGMRLGQNTHVRQVTALDLEAFQMLVNGPIFAAWRQDFSALAGKRININKPTTGTHQWSLDILKFAGLTPGTATTAPVVKTSETRTAADENRHFTPVVLGNPELLKALEAIKNAPDAERSQLMAGLPDAVLFADLVPSPIVQGLVNQANYRLVPLDFVPAYIQNLHATPHKVLDPTAMIEAVAIPAFSYGVGPDPVPQQSCSTLGVRRLLVAHKDVPAQAIVRCLSMLYDDGPDISLDFLEWAKVRPQYVPHDGVRIYDDERKQVLQNAIVKFVERLASLLGGIIGGILAIYGYFRWRRLLRFEHYFHEIRRIELIARGLQTDPAAPTSKPELLSYLRNQLSDLRGAAIVEFARGRLQGENLILSIFTLIKDTNNCLTSMERS